jgi:hypothetical protein
MDFETILNFEAEVVQVVPDQESYRSLGPKL